MRHVIVSRPSIPVILAPDITLGAPQMQIRIITIVLLALLAALQASPAQAMTAREYFADGNRLARDDLYWAALLRYSQAAEQGLDTPLLHYNTGITHYKAGQHIRAPRPC